MDGVKGTTALETASATTSGQVGPTDTPVQHTPQTLQEPLETALASLSPS